MHSCTRTSPARAPAPARALIGLILTVSCALVLASPAAAEACPGSGTRPCPYSLAQTIGQRAEGVLRFPEAVAVDTAGDVFVADQLGFVVQRFDAGGTFEGEWGSYGGGKGQFGPIGALATDAAANVYVVDSSHDRIEKFDSAGNYITQWGHRGSALGEFHFGSSQNSTQPPGGGIAVAGNYVYVADTLNQRIERFNLLGGEPLQWGARGSAPGQFNYPRGLAANESELIVADDDNHRIQKFAPEGAWLASAGENGQGPGQFRFPYGVALDAAGNVYVADNINARVVKLSPTLAFLGAWGGQGSKPGQLAFPRGLASDPAGDTYVADTANGRVQVFDPNGNYLRSIGIPGRGPGVLTVPSGLAADPTGALLVSDTGSNRLEYFSPAGETFVGQWTSTGGRFGAFSSPAGIAIDPHGSVYVADEGNNRLLHLWGDGTFLAELGGPLNLGGALLGGGASVAVNPTTGVTYLADSSHNRVLVYAPDGTLLAKWGAGEGGGAPGSTPGSFFRPSGVAVAPSGQVYVADTGNDRVVELSPEGAVQTMWGIRGTADGHFRSAVAVAVDPAGRVYVADRETNRIQEFGPTGAFLAKWGTRGVGPGEFAQPSAVAVDCRGGVYVADTHNNRVQRFEPVSPAPAPGGCLPAAAWPPPLDVAPVLHVSIASRNGILARRALALAVSCQRGCKILVTATIAPTGRRRLALVAAALPLQAARAGRVRLRVGPHTLRRLRGELGRRRQLKARVKVIAAGPTGRRTVLTRTYTVTR